MVACALALPLVALAAPAARAQVAWQEDFENGCLTGCLAEDYAGPNGAWELTTLGMQGDFANTWFVSCAENGNPVGDCGSGCGRDATLHVANVAGSPASGFFCPGGDCGAAYDASFDVLSDRRIASPVIDLSGHSGLTVRFAYLGQGQPCQDSTDFEYSPDAGANWEVLAACMVSDNSGCSGQGRWTLFSMVLPASADDNPNVRLGFRWRNDEDLAGEDPSFAVDRITIECLAPDCDPVQACCFFGGICDDLLVSECTSQGGTPQGPGTTCASTDCDLPTEACCFDDATCDDLTFGECVGQGGTLQGPGSECLSTACPVPAEACCFGDGTCDDLAPAECALQSGTAQGSGSECVDVTCPMAAEACCFGDGTCDDLAPAECALQSGAAQGPGTDCVTTRCPVTQACCFGDGTCDDLAASECALQSGAPQGPGSDCIGAICTVAPQACCFGDGTCQDVDLDDCLRQAGAPQGPGTDCLTTSCPIDTEACCLADGTCEDLEPARCAFQAGVAQGPGTDCLGTTCPVATEACCLPSGDCEDREEAGCLLDGGLPGGPGTDCAANPCAADGLPGEVPDGTADRPGEPLRVRKADVGSDLELTWSLSCSPSAIDYTVHEGSIGGWYDHAGVACDSGGALTSATITPEPGGRYFLVAPVTASEEGSLGIDSTGDERPESSPACRPARRLGCP